jgi:hypothetical protein
MKRASRHGVHHLPGRFPLDLSAFTDTVRKRPDGMTAFPVYGVDGIFIHVDGGDFMTGTGEDLTDDPGRYFRRRM